ncbi:GumC family protein [Kiloniella sp. b19]|uniref:GumC family protein n=1 Tax=Kiloniella sp. GXU_MW_B19 TaxID=3141326 RepID=UPI0031D3E2F6
MRNLVFKRLFYILHSAWRRRYLIVVPILLMPLAGLAVGLLTPNKYKTFATILIQEPSMQNPFLKDLMVETNLKKRMEALTALVHSRHILTEIAIKQGMIAEKEEDLAKKEQAIATLSKAFKVSLIGNELVRIEYEAPQAEGMVDTLNLVALRFVERVVAPQRYSIFKSRDFLQTEMVQRETDLLEAEQRLATYKSEFASELPELHARNVIRLSQIKDLLSDRQTVLQGARARYSNLRERLSQTNPVVGQIEEQIVSLMGELAVLRSRYTDQHSSIRGLLRKISALETERARALQSNPDISREDLKRLWDRASTIKSSSEEAPLLVEQLKKLQSVENEIQGLEQEVSGLETEYTEIETKVRSYGKHEREITNLERDLNVKRQIYEDLASRHQLAQVTGALGKFEEADRVKMIDPPFKPTAPSNLPLFVYIIIGLIAGKFLGISLATISEIVSRQVYATESFETLMGAPVIGRLPLQRPRGFDPKTGQLDLELTPSLKPSPSKG